MTRVVVVDLLCNSPYYSGPLAAALTGAGADAELASPMFYLEPGFLDAYPRSPWIADLVVHLHRPRFARLVVRAAEFSLNWLRLVKRIRAHEYDVVHVQWVPLEHRTSIFMRVLRAACDHAGTLLVFTAHNVRPHDRASMDATVIRKSLDHADLLVAHTVHVAKDLTEDVGARSPVVVIPHAPLFTDHTLPPRDEASGRLGLRSSPTALFLGLIRQYKGIDLLADAWPDVLAAVPGARLLVVGKVLDPQAAKDLERVRRQSGVEVIESYVSVATMLDYYAVSDLVVFPYARISQSGALMTAVGLGRPIVATPIDGLLEQVDGLSSAIVADDVSGSAVARAIVDGLSRRERLGAAAEVERAIVVDFGIGWAAVAGQTLAAYGSHLGAAKSTARPD